MGESIPKTQMSRHLLAHQVLSFFVNPIRIMVVDSDTEHTYPIVADPVWSDCSSLSKISSLSESYSLHNIDNAQCSFMHMSPFSGNRSQECYT